MIKLPPWTYGFLSDDENCPRKAWHKHVAKDLPREEKSEAQNWGIAVHKAFEKRLREKEKLPAGMERWEKFTLALDNTKASGATLLVEESLSINAQLKPVTFFAGDVWGRGRLDVAAMMRNSAVIFDWKTGKPNEDPLELETQAFMLKCAYPGLASVTGHYVWLKEDRIGPRHNLSDFARVYNGVRLRMKEVELRPLEQEWPAKPNPLCRFCPVYTCSHNATPRP